MPLSNKPLKSIKESDLQSLVENQLSDWKTIEYKQVLPGKSFWYVWADFFSDVTSLANTCGGHLIYGIRVKSGVPVEVSGLRNINVDAEIRRLETMILEGIEPRIPDVSIRAVALKKRPAAVIIICVPRSAPHRVKGDSRIYCRNSKGKYRLDEFPLIENAGTG